MTGPGPGRRPGDPEVTKQAILDAARSRFAERGFERATIRSIASLAGVDPALIHHHFGTKQKLFAAAHELPIDPAELVGTVAGAPIESRGEAIARAYMAMFATGTDSPTVSLVRAAATNEAAARMLREFITDVFLSRASELTDLDSPGLRLALVGSHMLGVAFGRVVVGIPDLADATTGELVAALAPTFQRYLTDPDLFGQSDGHTTERVR